MFQLKKNPHYLMCFVRTYVLKCGIILAIVVTLVSSKNITCVDLVLNVVEDGIVAVGDDGL